MRGVPLLIALAAVLVAAPAADAFTVTPSAAAAPTPLLSPREHYARNDAAKVSRADVARFLPLYRRAARRYDVPCLLRAANPKQEPAFPTAGGPCPGLNWVRCCPGPMQFSVTNGPVST